jgi:DNA-binding protein HU-beta
LGNDNHWKGAKMNKADLIKEVAEVVLSRTEAKAAVDCMLAKICEALKRDQKVSIAGFGSFRAVTTKPRAGRHPKTGARIHIPSKRIPKFTPSKRLKDYLN